MTSLARLQAQLALAGAVVAGFVALGCGDSDPAEPGPADTPAAPGGLSVLLSAESVAPGDQIEARVLNQSGEEFIYGAGYELEREVDGQFEVAPGPPRAVIQIAYIAKPGKEGPPVAVEVPNDAEPGTWRVVLLRDLPEAGDLAAEFEVVDG